MKGTTEIVIRVIAPGCAKTVTVSSIFGCIPSYLVYCKAKGAMLLFSVLLFLLGNG